MIADKVIDALDQSRDVIAVQAVLAAGNLKISAADREILRRLAGEANTYRAATSTSSASALACRHPTLTPLRSQQHSVAVSRTLDGSANYARSIWQRFDHC